MSNKVQIGSQSDTYCRTANISTRWEEHSDDQRDARETACQQKQDQVELKNNRIAVKDVSQNNEINSVERKSFEQKLYEENSRDERLFSSKKDTLRRRRESFDDDNRFHHQDNQITKRQKKSIVNSDIKDLDVPIQQIVFPNKRKLKTYHRSFSEGTLRQWQQNKFRYRSCPILLSDEQPTNDSTDGDLLAPFRQKPIAILSGSTSGLASVGLQNLVKRYTNISLPGQNESAWDIIEPHFSRGTPRVRFEAVFEIMQQYVDPNLSLLDVLTTDTPSIDRSHDMLAMLSVTSTVVTTNFDHLIEDAGRFQLGNDPNTIPFRVFCTEEHFKKAYHSISTEKTPDLRGLWKIHGTVAMWIDHKKVLVRADEDGGPVATLKGLSFTRESTGRRCFLHYLLETRPFIIINYSATDDFDVTRWLKTIKAPMNVLWIQHIENSLEPIFWNGLDIINGIPKNIASFDCGLMTMACVWHERGIADRLTVVTTADSINFLLQLIGLNSLPERVYTPQIDANTDYILSPPNRWQKYIVSGAMLSHLSYFPKAKQYYDYATMESSEGLREYCLARIAAAEASIEIGDRIGRIQAMKDALDTAETAPPSLSLWATRKSRFISAAVKRFVERDGQAIAIEELQELLNQCEKPEHHHLGRERNVALEAAILLTQLRRYLPSSPEPSDIARQWIEAIPKTGLLHTKAMNFHESALNKYQLATNIDEIDDAINGMKEAIEIREELGHIRGLVASLNVLGSMNMRRYDWHRSFELTYIKNAADYFRHSIEYSDKHATIFDQFQARIHLVICLLRYPSVTKRTDELDELLNYLQIKTTDDLRTQIESAFCLAMSIFLHSTLSFEDTCNAAEHLFDQLANKYTANNDVRLIRILAAARFNSELCRDWKIRQVHIPNSDLTREIATRKTTANINPYWLMRISRSEREIPKDIYEGLQLLLDPLSP